MATSNRHRGWLFDATNNRLAAVFDGTEVFDLDANDFAIAAATTLALGATITAGGLTVTAGGAVITAGDVAVTVGNYRAGPINTFATTEPTQSVIMEAGTAPAGAITTSSGIFASTTALNMIIANGTVSTITGA